MLPWCIPAGVAGWLLLSGSDTQAAAAVAFKHMCDSTSRHLVDEPPAAAPGSASHASSSTSGSLPPSSSFLPSLLAVYTASSSLRLSDQRDIIEGMCSVVSVLDQARLSHYLPPVLQPIVSALQAALAQPTSSGGKPPAGLYDGLDRLATLFNHLTPHRNDQPSVVQAAIMHCIQHCWPAIEQTMARYGGGREVHGEGVPMLETRNEEHGGQTHQPL